MVCYLPIPVLRCVLTGDASAASNTHEDDRDHGTSKTDFRYGTVWDLHELSTSKGATKYQIFWECCEQVLQDDNASMI